MERTHQDRALMTILRHMAWTDAHGVVWSGGADPHMLAMGQIEHAYDTAPGNGRSFREELSWRMPEDTARVFFEAAQQALVA